MLVFPDLKETLPDEGFLAAVAFNSLIATTVQLSNLDSGHQSRHAGHINDEIDQNDEKHVMSLIDHAIHPNGQKAFFVVPGKGASKCLVL